MSIIPSEVLKTLSESRVWSCSSDLLGSHLMLGQFLCSIHSWSETNVTPFI